MRTRQTTLSVRLSLRLALAAGIAVLFSTSPSAAAPGDCADCAKKLPEAPLAQKLAAPIVQQLARNDCEENESYLKWYPAAIPQVRRQLGPLALEGPEEQFEFARLILGANPPASWPQRAEGCKTVVCALGRVFESEESARRALVVAKRNGYAISLGQQDRWTLDLSHGADGQPPEQIWSPSEVRVIDEALRSLPRPMNQLRLLKRIYRIPDGHRIGSATAEDAAYSRSGAKATPPTDGFIALFEAAFAQGAHRAAIHLVHELCHHYDYQAHYRDGTRLSEQESFGFARLSWEKSPTDGWQPRRGASFVSDYAATSIADDFAETCAHFLIQPEAMAEKTPMKHEFFKSKVFAGHGSRPHCARERKPLPASTTRQPVTIGDEFLQ